MDPITNKNLPINASFELHQVDLAHGSFFALHRPLLGITNGPMFGNNHHAHMLNDEDFEGKYLLFSLFYLFFFVEAVWCIKKMQWHHPQFPFIPLTSYLESL